MSVPSASSSIELNYIDADGHIVEPPFGLQDYAPAAYRDRIYHVEIDDQGEEFVVIGDQRMDANVFTLCGAGGFTEEERLSPTRASCGSPSSRAAAGTCSHAWPTWTVDAHRAVGPLPDAAPQLPEPAPRRPGAWPSAGPTTTG